MNLAETRSAFQRWLHLPDTGALDAALAAVAANRLDGDPVWLCSSVRPVVARASS